MKRLLVAVTVCVAVAATASAAYATWTNLGTGSGNSTALLIGKPTGTSATANSSSIIAVRWSAPAAPTAAPAQYVVRRTAPTTATVCTVAATILTCTDSGLTASTTYTYTVEATVGTAWTSGQTSSFQATTPAPPAFKVVPATGTKTAGTAFTVTLTATTNGVTTDTTYTGAHTIVFSGPSNSPRGTAPTYPASVTFASGVATASITLVTAQTATLTAAEAARVGSASVTIVAAASSRLLYSTSAPSCASGTISVGSGGTFTSKVTITDTFGNPVTQGATATITLTNSPANGTLSPTSVSVPNGSSQSTASFLYTRTTANSTAVTVTAASGSLTTTACNVQQ